MVIIYPDDRILVAIVNNQQDWQRIAEHGWYRLPVKHAPAGAPYFDFMAFYFTKAFGDNKWAIHYYAPVRGHELLTRRDLIPEEPHHPRAAHWYFRFALGAVRHKIPPIAAGNWKRLTFIVTSGEKFEAAAEINQLLNPIVHGGAPWVVLKESEVDYW
jgi:hypothetical protein